MVKYGADSILMTDYDYYILCLTLGALMQHGDFQYLNPSFCDELKQGFGRRYPKKSILPVNN